MWLGGYQLRTRLAIEGSEQFFFQEADATRQIIPCKQVKHQVADHWILSFIIQQVPLPCSYFKFEERNKAGNSIIRHRTLTDNCQLSLSHSQICVQSIELYMVSVSYMKRTLPLVDITQIRYALHR